MIYCAECVFLNNACNEKLSVANEIKTPKVLGNFILRKGLSRQELITDIKNLESNREIIRKIIQRVKLKEKKVKQPFNDDGTTVLLHQLLNQSLTPEKLKIEKDLHRIRVTLNILRKELETQNPTAPSESARNLFKLLEARENSKK